MKLRQLGLRAGSLALLTVALGILAACGGGISQGEYDNLSKRLAAQEQKSTALQQQLSSKEKEAGDLQQKLAAQEKVAAAAPAPAAAKVADSSVTTLIGAKLAPTAAPAPPPTPLPAGAQPAPKAVPPASYDQPVGPFYFYVETLATTTVSKFGYASTVSCVPAGVFKRGMKLVWRFEVIDTATGKRLTDKDDATLKVKLPNGEESTGRFTQRGGGRVPDAPWMWSATWDIPLDFPLGAVDYSIVVSTKDGRTMTYKPPSLISKDTDTRPRIIE